MEYFQWSEELSVNIEEIDNQHQDLITLVNDVFTAVEIGKGDEILGEALNELIEFTKIHFATEVRLMKIHGYPDLASHENEHDELKNHVFKLNRRFNDGQSFLTTTVEKFLKDELINHFQKTDMKFGSFLNDKGVI